MIQLDPHGFDLQIYEVEEGDDLGYYQQACGYLLSQFAVTISPEEQKKLEIKIEDLKAEIEEWKCCEMMGARAMTYLAGKLSTGGKPSTTWILEAIKKVSEE